MIKSKRFLLTCIAFTTFIFAVFILKYEPVNVATGISIVLAPYLAVETFNKSRDNRE